MQCSVATSVLDEALRVLGNVTLTDGGVPASFFARNFRGIWLWVNVGFVSVVIASVLSLWLVQRRAKPTAAKNSAAFSSFRRLSSNAVSSSTISSEAHSLQSFTHNSNNSNNSVNRDSDVDISDSSDSSTLLPVTTQQHDIVPMDLAFENLGLRLANGMEVLRNVSGTLRHGSLTCVMGPSGSGKSTFLTALSGRANYGKVVGRTLINNQPDQLWRHKFVTGFVPQEDTMIRELSVDQILHFSASTRLDRAVSAQQKEDIVNRVLEDLDLVHVRASPIGDENQRGISGGQRKRVNVGIELAAQPSILLLDEPTSGLDSTASMTLMRCLKRLAGRGLTIAAVIHQPNKALFEMFDNVVLFAKGGKCVYFGSVSEMRNYFERLLKRDLGYNAIDDVMECISQSDSKIDFAAEWLRHFERRSDEDEDDLSSSNDERNISVSELGAPLQKGDQLQFWGWVFLALAFPPMLSFALMTRTRMSSQLRMQGALIGASIGTLLYSVGFMVVGVSAFAASLDTSFLNETTLYFLPVIFLGSYEGAVALTLFFISICYCRKRDPKVVGTYIVAGMLIGPFVLANVWSMRETKLKISCLIGFAIWFVPWGFTFGGMTISLGTFLFAAPMWVIFFSLSAAILVVGISRWKRLPLDERRIASFARQTVLQLKRAYLQIGRQILQLAFDIGLPFFTGISTALVFFSSQWTPPLTENAPVARALFGCYDCVHPFAAVPSVSMAQKNAICHLISLADDPYARLSLMASMGIGLCAVASSLQLFGANKANFLREQAAGLSTGAYYFGRSIAHLSVSAVAVNAFLLPFYYLLQPQANYGLMFSIFFWVHVSCGGVGMAASIIFGPGLSAIISVLLVLSFMLFSGSLFQYGVLRPDNTLELILWIFSWFSPLRWSYELTYLTLVQPLSRFVKDSSMGYATVLYGFSFDDNLQCWVFLLLLAFVFRLIPFLALIAQEKY